MLRATPEATEIFVHICKALEKAPADVQKKLRESLAHSLRYLATYACQEDHKNTECVLYPDFEQFSFAFMMKRKNEIGEYKNWFNGGLIFHGQYDNFGGTGSSITLEAVHGWSIHT